MKCTGCGTEIVKATLEAGEESFCDPCAKADVLEVVVDTGYPPTIQRLMTKIVLYALGLEP